MYKHLKPLINLLIFSPISDVKNLSYSLAQAAMFSTGAFDRNVDEIGAWLLFYQGLICAFVLKTWCPSFQRFMLYKLSYGLYLLLNFLN